MARDYATADEIRDNLRSQYDVVVDDRIREWSVGGDFGPSWPNARNRNPPYEISGGSAPVSDEDREHITAELVKRGKAKLERDYELADSIRDALSEEYNVVINDRQREWFVQA